MTAMTNEERRAANLIAVKKWRAKNKDRVREARAARHKREWADPEKRQRILDRNKAAYEARGHEYMKNYHLQKNYGITLDEYTTMLVDQGGVCAICGDPPKETYLHVDHDHDSGKVRGLLCTSCNVGVGMFRDDPERLIAAIVYLEG